MINNDNYPEGSYVPSPVSLDEVTRITKRYIYSQMVDNIYGLTALQLAEAHRPKTRRQRIRRWFRNLPRIYIDFQFCKPYHRKFLSND